MANSYDEEQVYSQFVDTINDRFDQWLQHTGPDCNELSPVIVAESQVLLKAVQAQLLSRLAGVADIHVFDTIAANQSLVSEYRSSLIPELIRQRGNGSKRPQCLLYVAQGGRAASLENVSIFTLFQFNAIPAIALLCESEIRAREFTNEVAQSNPGRVTLCGHKIHVVS
jgi:hypothetical protein